MSDLDDYTALFDRTGVVYEREEQDGYGNPLGINTPDGPLAKILLTVRASAPGPKNEGYSGFYAVLTFTADGDLVEFGVWE